MCTCSNVILVAVLNWRAADGSTPSNSDGNKSSPGVASEVPHSVNRIFLTAKLVVFLK